MVLVLVLIAAALVPAPADAKASSGPKWRGVTISPPAPNELESVDRDLDSAKAAGFNMIRIEIGWWYVEADADDTYTANLASYDYLFAAAAKRDLKVLPVIWGAPCWASAAPEAAKQGCAPDWSKRHVNEYPPADPADYAEFVSFVVKRWPRQIVAIEIWNEPDHQNEAYFRGPEKEKRYADLLKTANAAIKKADRDVQVLGGALVDSDGDFLNNLYKAGIKGHYDALSLHHYGVTLASLRAIRAVQKKNKDRSPLWIGEFGWPTCSGKSQSDVPCTSERDQGRFIGDIFRALGTTPYVDGLAVFNLRDDNGLDFGLTNADFSLKASLKTIAKVIRKRVLPAPRKVTLKVSGGKARGTAPAGDLVQVKAFPCMGSAYSGDPAIDPILFLDPRGRYSTKLPAAVLRGKWKLETLQFWTGGTDSVRLGGLC